MVEEVTPEQVKEKLDEGAIQIVDIRPPTHFDQGHLPGAINIPLAELPRRIDEVEWADDIVVACPIGQSSIQAARLIESYEEITDDTRVASMQGGYEAWEYDLERSEAEA